MSEFESIPSEAVAEMVRRLKAYDILLSQRDEAVRLLREITDDPDTEIPAGQRISANLFLATVDKENKDDPKSV